MSLSFNSIQLLVNLIVQLEFASSAEVWSVEDIKFGLNIASRAFENICWYEHFYQLPLSPGASEPPDGCVNVGFLKDEILKNEFFMKHPQSLLNGFADWNANAFVNMNLPTEYKKNCDKFWKDHTSQPEKTFSQAVGDNNRKYPFRTLSHCLLQTLEKRAGSKAITTLIAERVQGRDWKEALLERHNLQRALHGVDPIAYDPELTKTAQEWAEKNAKDCKLYHSVGVKYKDSLQVENLCHNQILNDKNLGAYRCAYMWYSEIRDFPFPNKNYDGRGPLFFKVGHFTQVVWKDTKFAGFGYAINTQCFNGTGMEVVAARYYPPGNYAGVDAINKNVFPLKGK